MAIGDCLRDDAHKQLVVIGKDTLYRLRFLGHRIEPYAAMAEV
jgi:hypothetical protein